jgi:hypothetical protein
MLFGECCSQGKPGRILKYGEFPGLTTPALQKPIKNGILATSPISVLDFVRAFLTPLSLETQSVLGEPNKSIEHVDFVETGIVSLMTHANRNMLEIASWLSRSCGGFNRSWHQQLNLRYVRAHGPQLADSTMLCSSRTRVTITHDHLSFNLGLRQPGVTEP